MRPNEIARSKLEPDTCVGNSPRTESTGSLRTMTNRNVSLIGVPTDVGAGVRGASMGPEALRVAGLGRAIAAFGVDVLDCGNLSGPNNPELPAVNGFRHLAEVAA